MEAGLSFPQPSTLFPKALDIKVAHHAAGADGVSVDLFRIGPVQRPAQSCLEYGQPSRDNLEELFMNVFRDRWRMETSQIGQEDLGIADRRVELEAGRGDFARCRDVRVQPQ